MAVSLTQVAVVAPNQVLLTFSGALLDVAATHERSAYAFATRFGPDVPLYASGVTLPSPTTALVTLSDAMLTGGHYQVAVQGIAAASGGGVTASANSLPFEGVGLPLWVFTLKRHAPRFWQKSFGSVMGSVLEALGIELDTVSGPGANSAVVSAQQALSLRTATGSDLSAIAGNYGVNRPDFAVSDDVFRALVPLLATQPKGVLSIFYAMLTAIVGPQATAGWQVYEVLPNQLVLEIPAALLSGFGQATLASATYLHKDQTQTTSAYPGDYLLNDASHSDSEVGLNPVILYTGINDIVDVINQIKAAGIVFSIYAP